MKKRRQWKREDCGKGCGSKRKINKNKLMEKDDNGKEVFMKKICLWKKRIYKNKKVIMISTMAIALMLMLCGCTKFKGSKYKEDNSPAYTGMFITESQSVIIDDYEIVLERYIYEKNTGMGYFEFCFHHDGKKVKTDKMESDNGKYVLNGNIDNRFFIVCEMASKNYFVDDSENDLHIFLEMQRPYFYNEYLEDFLYLTDTWQEDDSERTGCKNYYFNIQATDDAMTKKYYGNDLYISSLGVAISTDYMISEKYIKDMYLVMKNGKKIQVVSDGILKDGGVTAMQGEKTQCLWHTKFKKSIDYHQIDKIVIDGKELEDET